MTIEFKYGDLLGCTSVEALVNPVNCVGVMGKGLALQFRKRWPENFAAYKIACDSGELQVGTEHIHKLALPGRPSFIINLPTKVHWRDLSELEGVARGVVSLARLLSDVGIRSVAIPALGCGLGGLAWGDVRPLLESTFKPMANVDALIFEPDPAGPAAFRRGRE